MNHNTKNVQSQSTRSNRSKMYLELRGISEDTRRAAKIKGYNKQEGTKFTTVSQVREDYNKKNGTKYKTDNEFRKAFSRS